MSTFGGLSVAYSGLVAARRGMDVTGANIVNAGSETYTRQRVGATALDAVARTGLLPNGGVGAVQGVSAETISRLADAVRDARVADANAALGRASTHADALEAIERIVAEPGDTALAATLDSFWSGWQDVANQPGEAAPASVLLSRAQAVTDRLSSMRSGAEALWGEGRAGLDAMVAQVNADAASLADLNTRIRAGAAAGSNVGTLLDERDRLAGQLAGLVGGVVRARDDGMVDVVVDGDGLVLGTSARSLAVIGASTLDEAVSSPVRLEWAHRPGSALSLMRGGEAGGAVAALSADGAIARFAGGLDALATSLAVSINAVHQTGTTPSGMTGLDFFTLAAGVPAARALSVAASGVGDVATGMPGAGAADGSVAEVIGRMGSDPAGPSRRWGAMVADVGAESRSARDALDRSSATAIVATDMQRAGAGVSLDEENVALLTYQQSYQAAARVLTAIDEMLDVLINRTGIVGR